MVNPRKATIGNRQRMEKRPSKDRAHSFQEVALGYGLEQAIAEAERCLQCPIPTCVNGCPVEVDIPAFIELIKDNKIEKAISKIREKNELPSITGRVCPVELQCEASCVLNKKGNVIAIGGLERFAADYELRSDLKRERDYSLPSRQKVAVVGSGPAGLTVAADLAKLGYRVTVFESLHDVGGVLLYGIPEFRLPKKIVHDEVEYVKGLGVEFETNTLIGRTLTIEELFERGYAAIFIGAGAGTPYFLNILGENLNGIYSANEFLTRVNMMKAYKFPEFDTPIKIGKKVVVIGGGNVAVDAARSALRLGSDEVSIIYRRSREELPARLEEVRNAEEEGIKFQFLCSPTLFYGDEEGRVKGVEFIRTRLGEVDTTGRRKPIPIKGSKSVVETDTIIVAIGQRPNPLISRFTKGVKTDERGRIVVDESLKTTRKRVWAGGDIVSGEATVINAMGMGRKAAKSINQCLSMDESRREKR